MFKRQAELTFFVNQAHRPTPEAGGRSLPHVQKRIYEQLYVGLVCGALIAGAAVIPASFAQNLPLVSTPSLPSGVSTSVSTEMRLSAHRAVIIDPERPFVPRPMPRPAMSPPAFASPVVTNARPREVLVILSADIPEARISELSQDFGLELNFAYPSQLLAARVLLFHIADTRTVAEVVQQLGTDARIHAVQPDYIFTAAGASKPLPGSQYAPEKLHLHEAHKVAHGDHVKIAIIDTAIDKAHPALPDAIAATFGVLDEPKAASLVHGTAIASVIAGRADLTGVAPLARLLSVQAFASGTSGEAQSHTFAILKGLDWAVLNGARVVNMGFAGPNDTLLGQSIAAAVKKGVVIVAAAGNEGPFAPPAYPGAYPNVIAVTAVDRNDIVFKNANRGTYISIAAPGVDIVTAAPDASYSTASGTSLAAAQVSGIAALMLEKNPKLTSKDIRDALSKSARQPPRLIAEDMGAGIADAAEAVAAVK